MKITISNELKAIYPPISLGVLHYYANVTNSSKQLINQLDNTINSLIEKYSLETIAENEHIESTRQAYKALGKSPSEYRNAAEAMLRRIIKGLGLYHINNIVEVNNIVSISSGYSIGSYDVSKIQGNIELRHAPNDEHYTGIGKGDIHIGHLPVLYDELGPVGNPTSDNRRAMIQLGEQEIVSIIYSFDGTSELGLWMKKFAKLLDDFCNVRGIEMYSL